MKKTKKKKSVVGPTIPANPTANLTPSMRAELNATSEVFDNIPSKTSTSSSIKSRESQVATKTKSSKSTLEELTAEEKARKHVVEITNVNDVQAYDADVIETFSQSSGTISYDSIKSMTKNSLEYINFQGKEVKQNTDAEMQKLIIEQLFQDGDEYSKMRFINDVELNRRLTGQEVPFGGSREALPVPPVWGQYETVLTKKCINEVVENFFASPRDDIELTMRLTRRDMYPRLHIELRPLYEDLRIGIYTSRTQPIPFSLSRSRRGRFDDLLRTGLDDYLPGGHVSMQSMEDRSASMCYTTYSDATTARPPTYDYLTSAYSYLVAFVKSVVSNRRRSSTSTK